MAKFGPKSIAALETVHPDLRKLAEEAILVMDHSVLEGYRDQAGQDKAFAEKRSTKQWPNSKHNRLPSPALDVAPYPIDWKDTAAFARLFGIYEALAFKHGIKIRWGADWNNNGRTADEKFIDMPHIELIQ